MGEGHIMIELIIGIVIAIFAFPEIAIYVIYFAPLFFSSSNSMIPKSPEELEYLSILYNPMIWVHNNLSELHIVFKILIFIMIPLFYLIICHFIHIGPVYPLQIVGIVFMIVISYFILNSGFKLDIIWSISLTIVISLFTLGARLLTFKFLDSLVGGNPYLREKAFQPSHK